MQPPLCNICSETQKKTHQDVPAAKVVFNLPQFLVSSPDVRVKIVKSKSMGTCFLASCLTVKNEPADEFNAVRWKRQNLYIFYVLENAFLLSSDA